MLKLAGIAQKISAFHKRFSMSPKPLITNGILASAFSTLSSTKWVGTHNGSFHCDEALACFMLCLTKHFSGAQIVRTRDPEVLNSLDAVVDVGGEYDPSRHHYDHHQQGFQDVLGHGFTTKLSSAGLVYKHFGLEIIAKELELDEGHPHVHQLYKAIYRDFMEAIDAVDNGLNQYDLNQSPKYVIHTCLSSRIKRLNLDWMDSDQSCERENEAFHQAMVLAGCEFLENVHYYKKSWLPARSIVMECLAARETIDSSGEIIKLPQSCPWKFHIHELEEEMNISPSIKYVLYPDDRSDNWRLQQWQCHLIDLIAGNLCHIFGEVWKMTSFLMLLESQVVFLCTSGFIGGNRSYDGALAMARASLKA